MLGRVKGIPDRTSDDPDFSDSALDRAEVEAVPGVVPGPAPGAAERAGEDVRA